MRLVAIFALCAAACSNESGNSSGAIDPVVARAALTAKADDTILPATKAYGTFERRSLSFEMSRPTGDAWATHHLDVWSYQGNTVNREPGTAYIDGPDVNGRGNLWDHVDGTGLVKGGSDPWIDLLYCPYPEIGGDNCEMAREIHLAFADGPSAERVKATYSARLADGSWVNGTFLTARHPDVGTNDPTPLQ